MARAITIVLLIIMFLLPCQSTDEITLFLNSINPSDIFKDEKTLAQVTRELVTIREAHARRLRDEDIHPPEFMEQMRSLIKEDWEKEGVKADINSAKTADELLQPHTIEDAVQKGYKAWENSTIYILHTATDLTFKSLYICSPGGILSEFGILVAAACEFWLYGVPEASQPYYEADGGKFVSRLGFINHDGFHRAELKKTEIEFIKCYRLISPNGNIAPIPARLRRLLSQKQLTEKKILFFYHAIHERKWNHMDDKYVYEPIFEISAAFDLYTRYFDIHLDRVHFSNEAPFFRSYLKFMVTERPTRNEKEEDKQKKETYCHWLDPNLIKALRSPGQSMVPLFVFLWKELGRESNVKDLFPPVLSMKKMEKRKRENPEERIPSQRAIQARDYLAQIECLIGRGVSINAVDERGQSMAHMVCKSTSLYLLDFLVDHGGDLNLKDMKGHPPIYMTYDPSGARHAGHRSYDGAQEKFIRELIRAGANIDFPHYLTGESLKSQSLSGEPEPYFLHYFRIDSWNFRLIREVAIFLKTMSYDPLKVEGPYVTKRSGKPMGGNLIALFMNARHLELDRTIEPVPEEEWRNWSLDQFISHVEPLVLMEKEGYRKLLESFSLALNKMAFNPFWWGKPWSE